MTSQVSGAHTRPGLDAAHWQRRLNDIAGAHGIPGATLGILRLGEDPIYAHHGVLNIRTGVETTDDSVFQIGSVSKVWTTTAAMRLVEQGRLDLDAPVKQYLTDFRTPDDEATERITMRHLVNHTSGLDGDFFQDTGRGDDCVARYVALMADVPLNHPVGATMSYSNSAFVVAGRVIEAITGTTWDQAMRELVFEPLGLTATTTLPEDTLMYRAAVGHLRGENGKPELAPTWMLPRSVGPAGLIVSSAADVLEFARMHLRDGLASDNTRLLSAENVTRMQAREVEVPDPNTRGNAWGLGWILFDWDGHLVYGHDGGTIGQGAFLRILPEQGLAVVALTNIESNMDFFTALFGEIFAELADVRVPDGLSPLEPAPAIDPTPYLGVYQREGERCEVYLGDDGLRIRLIEIGSHGELFDGEARDRALLPTATDHTFVMREDGINYWWPVLFYDVDSTPYLHHDLRASRKIDPATAP